MERAHAHKRNTKYSIADFIFFARELVTPNNGVPVADIRVYAK